MPGRWSRTVIETGFAPVRRHVSCSPQGCRGLMPERHSHCVPIVLQKSQLDLRSTDAQLTPKMGFLAPASWGMRFLQEG